MSDTPPTRIELSPYWPPSQDSISTVHQLGDMLDVTTSRSPPPDLSRYRRLSKSSYCDERTGEVCTYKCRDSPTPASINRSFRQLHRLIVGNFSGGTDGVMLTLSVMGDYPADPSSLYRYYTRFWKKLKYHCPSLEYLAVLEPHQQTGRFHFHTLVKSRDGPLPRLDISSLHEWWDIGAVNIRRIYDGPGIATYLSCRRKRMAWLQAYQPHIKLWRASRGITRPTTTRMSRKEVKQYVESQHFRFDRGHVYRVKQSNGDGQLHTINTITHEHFRR